MVYHADLNPNRSKSVNPNHSWNPNQKRFKGHQGRSLTPFKEALLKKPFTSTETAEAPQGQFQTFMEMKMRRVNEMLAAIAGIPVDESEDGFLHLGLSFRIYASGSSQGQGFRV